MAEHRRLGELIRARREELGLTQTALAEKAGLSVDTIRNYEGGRGAQSVYWDTINRLARGLDLVPGTAEYDLLVSLGREHAPGRRGSKDRRSWLIRQIRAAWIKGVLEQRLDGLDFISLHMAAVARSEPYGSSTLAAALAEHARDELTGPSIQQVFESAGGRLLIVGGAGSGKTVMLLALAKALLKRAHSDREALQEEQTTATPARESAHQGGTLRELAASPLMLSIMIQSYDGVARDELPVYQSPEAQRRHLLDAYLARVFGRQDFPTYQPHQTRAALGWLAQQLQQRGSSLFFLDQLQPSWLESRAALCTYHLLDRLGGALISGLALSLGYAAIIVGYGTRRQLGPIYWAGLMPDLLLIFAIGVCLGGLFGGREEPQQDESHGRWAQVGFRTVGWVSGGLLLGLLTYIITRDIPSSLIPGIVGALAGLLMGRPSLGIRSIVLVEERRWSWERTVRLLPAYLSAGAIVGLLVGVLVGQIDGLLGRLFSPIYGSVTAGLLTGLLASLIFGVVYREDEEKAVPNQGVWRTARNAVRASLEGALGGSLFGALVMAGPVSWLMTALVGGLLGALAFGGVTVMSHLALRLAIWRHTPFPLRSVPFLEHAVERGVLQRVGGGYQFLHPLLRDHLAQEYTSTERTKNAFREHLRGEGRTVWLSLRWDSAAAALIMLAFTTSLWIGPERPNVPTVIGRTDLIIDASAPDYTGQASLSTDVWLGDSVTVEAVGVLEIGPWSQHISPAGVERGGLGFPLGDVYKRERGYPTGALLCRVSTEPVWRLCGERAQFVSAARGSLEFLVNDVETPKHVGSFRIAINLERGER